jgi:hypothetical protein
MSMGYSPGLAGRGLNSGLSQANNNLNQGTNNIGQVYQDMGQNYQQFGQAYQQATQAANQLRSASTTQQQQMNQYLQALQTALGGMSTAGQNTTNQQPMGDTGRFNAGQTLGATGEAGLNAGQQGLINAQTQFLTGTISPTYNNAVGGAQDLYNNYAGVAFGQPIGGGLLANPGLSPTGFDPMTGQPTGFQPLDSGIENTAYFGPRIINDPEIQTGIGNWYNARETAANQAGFTTGSPGYGQFITDYENQFGSSRPQYRYEPQDLYNQYASVAFGQG